MFSNSRPHVVAIFAVVTASCTHSEQIAYTTSIDPTGCLVEHVAAEQGKQQFHYDGLSSDGNTLAVGWRHDTESGLYLLDIHTGARTDIPNLNNGAVFSPDGHKLLNIFPAENGTTDIVEYDIATGEMTFIAKDDAWEWLASYSSDGNLILFNSYRTGASDIYTYRKSDGDLKRWTKFDGYDAHAQFSPDDSKILFNRQDNDEDFNLYVIEVETGAIMQLTNEPTEESYGSWSPDGNTIVFASDRDQVSGETDIYLMTANGADVRRITNHPKKDAYPFFSPDGKYIYFNSHREPQGIYRIKLDNDLNCVKGVSNTPKP